MNLQGTKGETRDDAGPDPALHGDQQASSLEEDGPRSHSPADKEPSVHAAAVVIAGAPGSCFDVSFCAPMFRARWV